MEGLTLLFPRVCIRFLAFSLFRVLVFSFYPRDLRDSLVAYLPEAQNRFGPMERRLIGLRIQGLQ